MENQIYDQISSRTGGDIYIGVVGPVRTGKSTFIKRFMEEMVLPNIADEDARARARDELPQSASGKTVMTAEPKFIPERGAHLKTAGGLNMNLRMVDCVGFPVEGALGAEENGEARLVNTPWSEEKMEFSAAARLGTEKVMREHSTVGVVVSTDGSIGELPRASYAPVEEEIVTEMKKSGKPFILLLNCKTPHSDEAQALAYLDTAPIPTVIKADGLALGIGAAVLVLLCQKIFTTRTLRRLMVIGMFFFADAGWMQYMRTHVYTQGGKPILAAFGHYAQLGFAVCAVVWAVLFFALRSREIPLWKAGRVLTVIAVTLGVVLVVLGAVVLLFKLVG